MISYLMESVASRLLFPSARATVAAASSFWSWVNEILQQIGLYGPVTMGHQAAEEWYAGAVALNHFLSGLPEAIQELHNTTTSHQWRAWIVNT